MDTSKCTTTREGGLWATRGEKQYSANPGETETFVTQSEYYVAAEANNIGTYAGLLDP